MQIQNLPAIQYTTLVEVLNDFYVNDIKVLRYSKGIIISQSPDAALILISPDGSCYIGFRTNGKWDRIRII